MKVGSCLDRYSFLVSYEYYWWIDCSIFDTRIDRE